MNGEPKFLIDTNILIYFFDGKLDDSTKAKVISILEKSFNISVITKIEFMGFRDFLDDSKQKLASEFINHANVIHLSDELVETIIELKRKYKIKLGDAIIASTALMYDFTIVTRNQKDFDSIDGLIIFNPFADNIQKLIVILEAFMLHQVCRLANFEYN